MYFYLKVLPKINFTQQPCENFREYSCGGWLQTNDLPAYMSSWSLKKRIQQDRKCIECILYVLKYYIIPLNKTLKCKLYLFTLFRKNKDQEHGRYAEKRCQFHLVELEDEAFLRIVHEPGQY